MDAGSTCVNTVTVTSISLAVVAPPIWSPGIVMISPSLYVLPPFVTAIPSTVPPAPEVTVNSTLVPPEGLTEDCVTPVYTPGVNPVVFVVIVTVLTNPKSGSSRIISGAAL